MSGGWWNSFRLDKDYEVQVSVQVRMFLSPQTESGNELTAAMKVDDKFFSPDSDSQYFTKISGQNSNRNVDTGFKNFTIDIGKLEGGDHTITIGGYLSSKFSRRERGRVFFRYITIEVRDPPLTPAPTIEPTQDPTNEPTPPPTNEPTQAPTDDTTLNPTPDDSIVPGLQPSCNNINTTNFNICYDVVTASGNVEPWMAALKPAAEKWERIIVADNGSRFTRRGSFLQRNAASRCNGYPETVDDIYVCVQSVAIDEVGGILGSAGPALSFSNPITPFPITGNMRLDVADLNNLIERGTLEDIVFHELGHILGIGTLWRRANLQEGQSEVYGVGREGLTRAEEEWHKIGCSGFLPVEVDAGRSGRDFSHWDENCLRREIMTPFTRPGQLDILSRMTIGTLFDIGYSGVDFSQADNFTLNDIDSSCPQCPEATGFQRKLQSVTEEESISDELLVSIRRYARGELNSLLSSIADPTTLDEDINSVADGYIDVLYFSESEGNPIRSMRVTLDEVGRIDGIGDVV